MRGRHIIAALVLFLALAAGLHASGPLYVAGVNGFNAGVAGTPITWSGGVVNYYTDRGALSPTVSESQADAILADAFSLWTSIPTAAASANRAGQLDEDVSGENVTRWSSLPLDLQPDSGKPVAIVYDYGGQVLDALLGMGAGANCDENAVFVLHDAFTADAHFRHALLIVNGSCATPSGLPFLRYRLERALGRLLGLDWSQTNENVASGSPPPTGEDFAGFPVMHPEPKLCTLADGCTYIPGRSSGIGCAPAMDDRAALSRLYPVTASSEGKRVFRDTTARVHGVVRFTSGQGIPGQGMQGVNVVATRLTTDGNRSTDATAASVSGFLFRGNAGNPVTGVPLGAPGDRWGATDTALEGYYDLSGLEIPQGTESARYELRLEPINPAYSGARAFGPHGALTPAPSGHVDAVVVTVAAGGEQVQDFTLEGTPAELPDSGAGDSFAQPARLPGGGIWAASLSPYGDVDWYLATFAAGGTFTLDITAVDEDGAASERKALPVAGLWSPAAVDETAPPLMAATYFTSGHAGVTRLQGSIGAAGDYKLGVADYRGDGRPDYRYVARLLAISQVEPGRASTGGGTVVNVRGSGFGPELTATVAGASATVLSVTPDRLLLRTPAAGDGRQTLTLTDPLSGVIATASLTYGGGADDRIAIIGRAGGPSVPVGAESEQPIRILVTTPAGAPVAGATVTFSANSGAVKLLPCNAAVCTRATDATGEAWVSVLGVSAGAATVTAGLANGASAAATVGVTASADAPTLWCSPQVLNLPQGASAVVPLKVLAIANGVPQPGRSVGFDVYPAGAATLSTSTATTDQAGAIAITVSVTNLQGEIDVAPYFTGSVASHLTRLRLFRVAATAQKLQLVSGDGQVTSGGFGSVVVRAVDSASPPDLLPGVAVRFTAVAYRPARVAARGGAGDYATGRFAQRAVVGVEQATVTTDTQGRASYTPSFAALGAVEIQVMAEIAGSAVEFNLLRIASPASIQPASARQQRTPQAPAPY